MLNAHWAVVASAGAAGVDEAVVKADVMTLIAASCGSGEFVGRVLGRHLAGWLDCPTSLTNCKYWCPNRSALLITSQYLFRKQFALNSSFGRLMCWAHPIISDFSFALRLIQLSGTVLWRA